MVFNQDQPGRDFDKIEYAIVDGERLTMKKEAISPYIQQAKRGKMSDFIVDKLTKSVENKTNAVRFHYYSRLGLIGSDRVMELEKPRC